MNTYTDFEEHQRSKRVVSLSREKTCNLLISVAVCLKSRINTRVASSNREAMDELYDCSFIAVLMATCNYLINITMPDVKN